MSRFFVAPDSVRGNTIKVVGEEAKKHFFKVVSLGQRVLKSDTAGLAALAILNYELSN